MKAIRNLIENADNNRMNHWTIYLDYFELDARSRQLSKFTIKVNGERLALLARWLDQNGIDIEDVTRNDIQKYLLSIYGTVSDETVAGRIRTYKRFWNVLIEGEVWNKPNPMDGIKKPRVSKKLRRTISPVEFDMVLGACQKRTFLGYRNFIILLLLWDCMLRRGEIASLRLDNVDLRAGTLIVKGKGNKVRIVPMGAKTIKSLHFYIHKHRSKYAGNYLFCTHQGKPISLVHIHQICSRTAKKAGLKMGCHIIRHSSATEYLRRGGQLGILSKILGHTDITTTAIYTHMSIDDAVKSYEQYSPASSLSI
ncbi:MAG: tyrosine-type recombinase/integrase [Candidatus Zixiibacteriota bacterium]